MGIWSRRWVQRHGEQALHQKVDMGATKADRVGTRPEVGVKSSNAAADSALQAYAKSCHEGTGLAPRAHEGKGGFCCEGEMGRGDLAADNGDGERDIGPGEEFVDEGVKQVVVVKQWIGR